jgi:hypothetical protein
MVNTLRVQSPDVPRRRIWRSMVSPDCCFHSHTFSMSLRGPGHHASGLLAEVARHHHFGGDAAWSVPICHNVS